jgi:tryptophan 2,3-dioxygenase
VSFTSFRSFLASSSGFESAQFREFEFALGHKRMAMVKHHESNPRAKARLERRYGEPTIYDAFLRFLVAHGYDVPAAALERDVTQPLEPMPDVQPLLIRAYHHDPPVRTVCESLVDLDEGLQEWRYRHVKMVERTIGMKVGTGGSPGVEYLRQTLFRPVFPDLWAIRSSL